MANTPCKIFINNLPTDMDTNAVFKYFSRYGEILKAFVKCGHNGVSRGQAFITFKKKSCAQDAIEDLNGANFEGKILKVAEAFTQTDYVKDPRVKGKLPPFELAPDIMITPEISQYKNMLEQLKQTIILASQM